MPAGSGGSPGRNSFSLQGLARRATPPSDASVNGPDGLTRLEGGGHPGVAVRVRCCGSSTCDHRRTLLLRHPLTASAPKTPDGWKAFPAHNTHGNRLRFFWLRDWLPQGTFHDEAGRVSDANMPAGAFPLGATLGGVGANFSLFFRSGTRAPNTADRLSYCCSTARMRRCLRG
jgi:hypothetical protein